MNMKSAKIVFVGLSMIIVVIIGALIGFGYAQTKNNITPKNKENNASMVWIISPKNGSTVSGIVDVIVYNVMCNCSGVTKLYIDGKFINNGILKGEAKTDYSEYYIQIFHHDLDTTEFNNGIHELKIIGKHNEQTCYIEINIQNN